MIRSIRSDKYRSIWTGENVLPFEARAQEIVRLLDMLDVIEKPLDLEMSIYRLEHLGVDTDNRPRFGLNRANHWQISFSWEGGNAYDVDVEEY